MTPRAPAPGDVGPYRPPLLRDDSTHSKLSAPLSSHSNEADDEQSLSDPSYDMESTADPPRYDGEDTRMTSDKELAGFYMYGWAAEVCHVPLLPCRRLRTLPVLLCGAICALSSPPSACHGNAHSISWHGVYSFIQGPS
jgi:hypothetical protein